MSDPASDRRYEEAETLIADLLARGDGSSDFGSDGVTRLVAQRPDLERELRELWSRCATVAKAFDQDALRLAAEGARVESLLRDAATGVSFGERYAVETEIGRGGMGAVLRVVDRKLERPLAMKVIVGQASAAPTGKTPPVEPRQLARFLNEARITGQLDHPGIVPVHEVGVDEDGRAYFTMKLVKGVTLSDAFERRAAGDPAWPTARVLRTIERVCEAMAFAHERGVIHRDLKPANVMIGDFGEVYVMDWGLARRLAHADPETDAELASQARTDAPREAPSLRTGEGEVLGTPPYMSPEQARGQILSMGPPADVYSIGAMLYQLISGSPPYVEKGERVSAAVVVLRIMKGPPKPLHAPDTPAELVAICEKAMAPRPEDRYATVKELAQDLDRFVTGRTVLAFRTGAWAETTKWVRRNPALAGALAGVVLVSVAGATAFAFKADAERRARDDVLALSAQRDVDELVARADQLWPAVPALIPEYERWLRDVRAQVDGAKPGARGGEARRSLEQHRERLATLRSRATELSPDTARVERESHPLHARWRRLRAELDWRARMLARSGWPTEAEAQASADRGAAHGIASEWGALALGLVEPGRPEYGRESEALVLARRAADAEGESPSSATRRALAWALFMNGQLDQAQAAASATLVLDERRELEHAIACWREPQLAERRAESALLEAELTELERELEEARSYAFASVADAWWSRQLGRLVNGLESLVHPRRGIMGRATAEPCGWGVEARLEFARTIAERSVSGEAARGLWSQAISAVRSSALYGGLELAPQLGLLPLGPDPESGLWEFAHLASGEPPPRAGDGRLVLDPGSGVVLVLVPGGRFWMGRGEADREHSTDVGQEEAETPRHEVELAPFLLSKYELTQGQWRRASGGQPSALTNAVWTAAGERLEADLRPVESITHEQAASILWRMDLELPTEAQWEYAARAAGEAVWWTGPDPRDLRQRANLEGALDGAAYHTAVGRFPPNAFGLHDMAGNVWEWCRDKYAPYSLPARAGDGLRGSADRPSSNVVARGGSWSDSPPYARSAFRYLLSPLHRRNDHGVRAARRLDP